MTPKPRRRPKRRTVPRRDPWYAGVAERLCAVTEGLPLRTIGARTGYNHETVRRVLHSGRVTGHFLATIARVFGLSGEWLLTGRGRKLRRR